VCRCQKAGFVPCLVTTDVKLSGWIQLRELAGTWAAEDAYAQHSRPGRAPAIVTCRWRAVLGGAALRLALIIHHVKPDHLCAM
jgi:hypothetical protein